MNPDCLVVPVGYLKRMFPQNAEAQIVENGHNVRKRQRLIGVEELEVHRAFIFLQGPIKAHGQVVTGGRSRDMFKINSRPARREHIYVARREARGPKPE